MAYINGKETFFGLKKVDVKKEELTVAPKTEAQTFEPEEGAYYSKVNVSAMNLSPLVITENGEYTAQDCDGFSSVVVNVAGGELIEGAVLVTFLDYNGASLYSRHVFIGDDCESPVTRGQIAKPTRETDVRYIYTFSGWTSSVGGTANSSILNDITEDKTVYAAYSTEYVLYTVRWYDGETLMKTEQVRYEGTATPPSTEKSGYVFDGWNTTDFTIYEDTDFYGTWSEDTAYAVKMADAADLPSATITSLAYNADGSRLLAVNANALYEYDTTTEPYTLLGTHTYYSTPVPNGNAFCGYINNFANYFILYGTGYPYRTKYTLKVFDSETHSQVSSATYDGLSASTNLELYSVAVSSDQSKIALYIYTSGPKCRLFRVNGASIQSYQTIDLNTTIYNIYSQVAIKCASVTFNEDASVVIVTGAPYSSSYKALTAIDTETFENLNSTLFDATELGDFDGYSSVPAFKVQYSPDGKYLAVQRKYGSTTATHLKIYDTQTTPYTLLRKSGSLRDDLYSNLCFSPDSKTIGIAYYDSSYTDYLHFYDVETLNDKGDIETNLAGGATQSAVFNHDGTRFAIGHSGTPYFSVYKTKV